MEKTGRKTIGKSKAGKLKEDKSLKEVLDKVLDKGIVVDTKARIYLEGVKGEGFIGLDSLITLASLETGSRIKDRIGLEFPEDVDLKEPKRRCPQCNRVLKEEEDQCPWCGFKLI